MRTVDPGCVPASSFGSFTEPVFTIPPDTTFGPSADVLPLAGEANWGIAAFDVDRLRRASDGGGLVVGVVDTGIDDTHPLIAPAFKASKDFTGSPVGARDRQGHGTHVSGTIGARDPRIGMAPNVVLVHGKGLGDGGSGSGSAIAAAMRWCVEQGAEIVSMSLGSSGEDSRITSAMRELAAAGVWVFCAAGNSGGGTPDVDWPARSEHCISVAALGSDLQPASFTNRGAKIDTSGPGVGIWSTRSGGGYQQMSGTSMATPGVAGIMALYRAALKAKGRAIPNVLELRAKLFSRSTDTHTPGDDLRTGPGWVSPLLLELDTAADPPPVTP